jgi:hypothetical protein
MAKKKRERHSYAYFLENTAPTEEALIDSVWWWMWVKGGHTPHWVREEAAGNSAWGESWGFHKGIFPVRFWKKEHMERWNTLQLVFPFLYQWSAFLYELGARVNGEFEFGVNWLFLPGDKKDELARRWPIPDPGLTRVAARYSVPPEMSGISPQQPGFSRTDGVPAFNLRLNDKALIQIFLRFIRRERTRQEIPNPKPNEGTRNRPRSWKPIEYMDIQRFAIRPLEDGERSQVAKARRLYQASI